MSVWQAGQRAGGSDVSLLLSLAMPMEASTCLNGASRVFRVKLQVSAKSSKSLLEVGRLVLMTH